MNNPFLKVIAGIENRDLNKVLEIASVAAARRVDAIDICDDETIIKAVKEKLVNSSTKLFVSSLSTDKLLRAHSLGADYLELGNFDHLYEEGQTISSEAIVSMTTDLISHLGSGQNLSVTIPGYLSVNEQSELAQTLYEMGVAILQTEGGAISKASSSGAIGQIEKAKVTLANTLELKAACPNACIMAAGGLSPLTIPLALAAGADGIGIGKAISKLGSQIEMIALIQTIQEKMNANKIKLQDSVLV